MNSLIDSRTGHALGHLIKQSMHVFHGVKKREKQAQRRAAAGRSRHKSRGVIQY